MKWNLAGRKAIVNGGARGIGCETVLSFVREGADVVFGSRNQRAIDDTLAAASAGPGKAIGHVVDVGDSDGYRKWLANAASSIAGCDIFVHTASSSGTSTTDWELGYRVDVMGAVHATEVLKDRLAASGSGSVIFISSTAAVETFFRPTAFNAMKAALLTYAKQLSQDWGRIGVRVNAVTPGPVEFEGGNWQKIRDTANGVYEAVRADIPLGRLGSPRDVASTILFLASAESAYVTGTNIIVDGGYTKRVQF
jgi:NAD(P)-dependent dehydrogenase (short-subunit alcohol dehydrogenase family)